jgi:hypothetical protein
VTSATPRLGTTHLYLAAKKKKHWKSYGYHCPAVLGQSAPGTPLYNVLDQADLHDTIIHGRCTDVHD